MTNDFGGVFGKPKKIDFGFNLYGSGSRKRKVKIKKKRKEPLKRKTYTADFYDLMDKQNKLCADPLCSKRHGKRLSVSTTRDLDHKFPIKLWELIGKKGDPNNISNLQLLCPDCHRIKTAFDKKRIAKYKQEQSQKEIKTAKAKKPKKRRRRNYNPYSTIANRLMR